MPKIHTRGTNLATGLNRMDEDLKHESSGLQRIQNDLQQLSSSFKSLNEEFLILQNVINHFRVEREEAREQYVSGPRSMICTTSRTRHTDADADTDTDLTPPSRSPLPAQKTKARVDVGFRLSALPPPVVELDVVRVHVRCSVFCVLSPNGFGGELAVTIVFMASHFYHCHSTDALRTLHTLHTEILRNLRTLRTLNNQHS